MSRETSAILDAALDSVILIDERGTIVGFNSAAELMFGYSRDVVIGRELAAVLIPERLRTAHRLGLERIRESGESIILGRRVALTALRADGVEFQVELTISRVEESGLARYVGFLRDETARLASETERNRLAAIVSSSSDACWSCDLQGRITSWNAAAERLLGYEASEALALSIEAFVSPDRAQFLYASLASIARGESIPTYEALTAHRDGTPVEIEVTFSPIRRADGNIGGMSALLRDIGERRRSQHALAHQARILATVRDALIEIDAEFRIVGWNAAAEHLYGWAESEVIGRPVNEVLESRLTGLDRDAVLQRLAEDGHVVAEAVERARSGEEIIVEASIIALRDGDGPTIGYVTLNRDIRARRRLEDQLRDARQLEAIGRLAGGIAHEFNNLLTSLLGYGDLVLAQPDLPPTVQADVEEIVRAGRRADVLTQQLLALGRQQILQPGAVNLNAIVRASEEMLRRLAATAIKIDYDLATDLVSAEVDAVQIEQVLRHLVENACEAMPKGGRLSVGTANAAAGDALPPALAPGAYAILSVADTGRGMDAETRARLFEPYFTTKAMGDGLGLATTYGIVRQSGGEIAVTSEPGSGSRFEVFLPCAVSARAGAGAAKPQRNAEGTVLVIDDEAAIRALMARLLRRQGFAVLEAGEPDVGLQFAREARSQLSLLVCDVVLPGTSGGELSKQIVELCPGLRVLLVSGFPEDADARVRISGREIAYLAKPFTPDTFVTKVREVLAAPA